MLEREAHYTAVMKTSALLNLCSDTLFCKDFVQPGLVAKAGAFTASGSFHMWPTR